MWKYNSTDELYHYGILGMKWGHRKAQLREYHADRKGRKEFKKQEKYNRWLQKQNAKSSAKQQRINNIDKKISKSSVGHVVNVNRAKMGGHALGALAGASAVTLGAAARFRSKYSSPKDRWYLYSVTNRATNLKNAAQKANHWYKPISKMKVAKETGRLLKDTERIRKDHRKFALTVAAGSAIVAGIAGKKIHDLHKENKIAKDYNYREYKKKQNK